MRAAPYIFLVLFLWVVPVEAGDSIGVSAVGDIMMGSTYPVAILPPDDGKGIFNGVKDAFKDSDIVFGNLEGPLTDGGNPQKCKEAQALCYEFRTPPGYALRLMNAGFNVMSIANNHSCDFGKKGMEDTVGALEGSGIRPAGGERIAYISVKDKRVAFVGFSFSSSCSPYAYHISNIESAKETVSRLKAGGDIVIVSFHGGAEGKGALRIPGGEEVFAGEKRGDVVLFARAVIDAGADMVIGHGPHVLRALETYKGKLIAYSLGNFLTYGRFNTEGPSGTSLILRVRLDAQTGDFLNGRLVPVKLMDGGIPRTDTEGKGIRLIKALSEERGDSLVIKETGEIAPASRLSGSFPQN